MISTGTYNASDTKISGSYVRGILRFPIKLGVKSSLYLSNYGDYSFNTFSFSTGFSLRIEEQRIALGMSIHNLATNSGDLTVDFYPKVVISGSKNLKHLPLNIFLDLTSEDRSDLTVFIEVNLIKKIFNRLDLQQKAPKQNIKKIFSVQLLDKWSWFCKEKNIINYSVYVWNWRSISARD